MRILIVDDEPAVRESLRRSLAFNGFTVDTANDGAAALAAITTERPDAVILDVMMPKLDGLETCRRLRAAGDDIPVLMLTARDEVSDRVAGLDAGADDYLAKPFALEELLARLRAMLRRIPTQQDDPAILRYDDLVLDVNTRDAHRGDRNLRLTRTEFNLLHALMRRPRQVLSRDQLLDDVWGFDFATTANSLEVYIGYLRRKTEEGGEKRLIHTMRGIGYVIREDAP